MNELDLCLEVVSR